MLCEAGRGSWLKRKRSEIESISAETEKEAREERTALRKSEWLRSLIRVPSEQIGPLRFDEHYGQGLFDGVGSVGWARIEEESDPQKMVFVFNGTPSLFEAREIRKGPVVGPPGTLVRVRMLGFSSEDGVLEFERLPLEKLSQSPTEDKLLIDIAHAGPLGSIGPYRFPPRLTFEEESEFDVPVPAVVGNEYPCWARVLGQQEVALAVNCHPVRFPVVVENAPDERFPKEEIGTLRVIHLIRFELCSTLRVRIPPEATDSPTTDPDAVPSPPNSSTTGSALITGPIYVSASPRPHKT